MDESTEPVATRLVDWLGAPAAGVAITGASGWIGAAAADAVLRARPHIREFPLRLFGSAHGVCEIGGRRLPIESLADAAPLGAGEWVVLHFAIVGADRLGGDLGAFRAANDSLLDHALALARTGALRRFVYASSGAVYQSDGSAAKQAYAAMKRAQEEHVQTWSARGGAPVLMPRIFNVGGPHINHVRAYALGDFIAQALEGETIRIEAQRAVIRSYVHVHELAQVVLRLALDASAPTTFDTAGTEVVELAELARAVGTALQRPVEVRRPPLQSGEDRYVGDGRIYQEAVARSGVAPVDLDRIIRDTAAFMQRSGTP